MAEADVQGMLVRIEATTAQMRQEMARGESVVEKTSKNMDGSLARVDTAFDRAGTGARGMQGVISSIVSTFGGFNLAAAGSVAGLVALTQSTISHAQEIKNLSSVANTSVEDFQRMAFGAKSVGVEQDKLGDILKDVNDRVGEFIQRGGGEMSDFFKEIAPRVGVTADQFKNLSGPQALQLYYDSLQKAGLNQQQLTTYMEQMADEATALIPLLRDNGKGFKDAGDQADKLGSVISKFNIERLVDAGQAMRELEATFSGVGQQIAVGLLPGIESVTAGLANLRDTGGAQKLGETIGFLAENVDILAAALGGKLAAAFSKYAIDAVVSAGAAGKAFIESTAAIKASSVAHAEEAAAAAAGSAAKLREAVAAAGSTKAIAAEAAARVANLNAVRESLGYQAVLAAGTQQEKQLKASLAAIELELAAARKAATAAATAEAAASNAAAAAMARDTAATQANAIAQAEAAAAKGVLARAATGLLGLLGGPAGIAALAIGAGVAFLTMGSNAKSAGADLGDLKRSAAEVRKEFESLTRAQQRSRIVSAIETQETAAVSADQAFADFLKTTRQVLGSTVGARIAKEAEEARKAGQDLSYTIDDWRKRFNFPEDGYRSLTRGAEAVSTLDQTTKLAADRVALLTAETKADTAATEANTGLTIEQTKAAGDYQTALQKQLNTLQDKTAVDAANRFLTEQKIDAQSKEGKEILATAQAMDAQKAAEQAATKAKSDANSASQKAATLTENQAKALTDLKTQADIAIRSATGLADAFLAGTDRTREFTLQQKVEEALLKTSAGARDAVTKAIQQQMAAEDRLAVSKQAYSLQQEATDQIDLAKATLQGADALAEYNVQKALKVALAGKDITQASVEYEALVKATRAQQDALDIARKATAAGSILDRLYPEQKLLRDYTEEQKALNAAMALYPENAAKYQEAMGRLELEYQSNQAAATTWGQVTIAAVDRIDDAFADMWKSVLSKSGNFMDTLKNSFRQFLAEMLHLAITKPIIVQIGSALGVGGLAGSAAGGGGAGGGLSVSSLWNAASSAYRLGTSGFGSALSAGWSAGEGFLGGLQGAISSGSSYISSALASLFGSASTATAYQSAIATGASQFGAQFSMQAGAQASWGAASGAAASGTGAAASGGLSLGGLASAALPAAAAFAAFKAYEAYKNGVRLDASDTRGNAAAWATGFQPIAELNGAIGKLTDKLGIGGALGNLLNIPGTITAMIGSALFGGKWQTKDTGISLGVNDGDFLGQQFVYQKKKGGLFGKNKKRTRYSALDPEVESALQDTYDTTQESVVELLDRIGVSVGEGAFAGLQIARQQISTKGKTSEQIQEEISKIFSGFADQMVSFIDQGVGGFGYSYADLAERVNVFESFNKSLGLVDVAMLKLSPHSMELANALVTAAGGMEAYTESLNTYFEAFFSESERADKTLSAVQEQFKAMNVALPETREGYRKVVEALDLTTETGQQMYLTLMGAAGAAAQAYDILESRAAAAAEAASAAAEAYAESLGAYLNAFFTDAERTESTLAAVQEQFKAMNVALPETREGYRKVVEALDLTTATGQQMYRTLIGAAGSAAQAYDVLEARAAASAQAAQEEAARVAALLGSNVTAAMGAVQRAVNAQKTALTEAFNAQTASLNDMSQTAQKRVTDLTSVSNSLGSALKSLRGDSADAVKMLRSQAQATLANALAASRAGKSLSSIPGLEDALQVASQNSTAAYASLEAFNRDQGRTANVVSQLNAANGKHLTAAEKTVESLQAQIAQAQKSYDLQMAQYDAQLSLAQAQVDALNGVDNSIVSVAAAVDRLSYAITASLSIKDANAARQNTSGNNVALLRAVYQAVLGRELDASGLATWTAALQNGSVTYANLMDTIARGGAANGEAVRIPGYASGGMFSGGLRLVGERGPELEVTGPSRIYNAGQTAAMLAGGQDEATAAEVRELRAELKSALFAIAKYTQKAAKNTDLLPQKLEQELYP
ncbi:hypothetical protein [Pseudomonas alabamensis]|uniref:hypothetical protein n=1 Tax=Pseudomonas alabamensis TaxID=3064349 RepID=UPI000745AEBD|nr:hypothetical protein APT63_11715 [Pseudomonas monteilii]